MLGIDARAMRCKAYRIRSRWVSLGVVAGSSTIISSPATSRVLLLLVLGMGAQFTCEGCMYTGWLFVQNAALGLRTIGKGKLGEDGTGGG